MNNVMAEIEVAARQEFAASGSLRVEFGDDIAAYIAFKKAEAQGRTAKPKSHITITNMPAINPVRTRTGEIEANIAAELSALPGQIYDDSRNCFVSGPAL